MISVHSNQGKLKTQKQISPRNWRSRWMYQILEGKIIPIDSIMEGAFDSGEILQRTALNK